MGKTNRKSIAAITKVSNAQTLSKTFELKEDTDLLLLAQGELAEDIDNTPFYKFFTDT